MNGTVKLGSLLGTHCLILMMGRLTKFSPIHGATSVIRLLNYLDGEKSATTSVVQLNIDYLRGQFAQELDLKLLGRHERAF